MLSSWIECIQQVGKTSGLTIDGFFFVCSRKPERGIRYLIAHRFLEPNAQAVARFLLSRKGLSRQMIGEYLGNLQDTFAMQVLQ